MKAIWQGTVIADSDDTEMVEGNYYFPLSATKQAYLEESDTRTNCPWKGVASYFNVIVNGELVFRKMSEIYNFRDYFNKKRDA